MRKCKLIVSIILICFFQAAPLAVAVANQQEHKGQDLSSRYEQLMPGKSKIWYNEHTTELMKFKVIFVPGFLSTVILGLGSHDLAKHANLGEYFNEHMKWLDSMGVENERVDYNFEGSPGENAVFVHEAVKKSNKPVILVAHSKGGLDTIEALMAMDQGELAKVKGLLALQVPFYGSPIADTFTDIKSLSTFARWTLSKLNVSYDALYSLKMRSDDPPGEKLMNETLFMSKLAEAIPVLSFASFKSKELDLWNPWQALTGQDTIMFHSRSLMEKNFQLKNDGLVPVTSAVIPGSNFIITDNVDHAVPVMYCQILKFDRIRFLQTTLRMILETKAPTNKDS